jgi:hypothetical protein
MKLTDILKESKIVLEGPIEFDQEYTAIVNKIKNKGGKFKGSGDYGAVYELGGKAVKVTTDEVEIEHALKLVGKKTEHFVRIYNVKQINPKLGVITMDLMQPYEGEVSDEFKAALENEAEELGIDPDELDMGQNNFMKDPKTGQVKMTDV